MTTTKRAIQPWLLDELVKSAVIDGRGINDRPRRRTCPCGARVWMAWAHGTGPVIAVDDITLTPLGELQALTAGRQTVEHWPDGLDLRHAESITRWPADTNPRAYPVRPEHKCGTEMLDHYPEYKRSTEYDEPPF